jgi:hypothetical protein
VRGLLVIAAGGIVLMMVGFWYLLPQLSGSVPRQFLSINQTPDQTDKPKPAPTSTTQRQPGSQKSRSRSAVDPEQMAALLAVPPAITTVNVPVGSPPPPTARDLKLGMDRSEIERIYGPPTLSTTQAHGGMLLQRYYYLDRAKSRTTVALMENGRVIVAADAPR